MPPLKRLPDDWAAYVAGVVDGEGTVTLTRTHRGESRRAIVSISNTELPLLKYIQSLIGAGRITKKMRVQEHHSPGYTYVISSRKALALLAQISPYLHTYKAGRAQLLLEEYVSVTPRNGKYTEAQRAARAAFEARFFAIRTRAGNPVRRTH